LLPIPEKRCVTLRNYGPVDVLVASVPSPRFDGRIMATIERLTSSGAIRVLDAMLLVMDEDGTIRGLDVEDVGPKDAAMLGYRRSGTRGLFDSANADEFTQGMVPGSAVVALAIEGTRETVLRQSLMGIGADMAFTRRLPSAEVHEAFDEPDLDL